MTGKYIFYDEEFDMSTVNNSDIWWKTINLLPIAIKNNSIKSNDFIKKYKYKNVLDNVLEFCEYNIDEIAGLDELGFVTIEIQYNIYHSLYLASAGFYKEAKYNIRSALELSLFITSEMVQIENIKFDENRYNELVRIKKNFRRWLISGRNTPNKKDFINIYKCNNRFNLLFDRTNFINDFNIVYNYLNDNVHTKGMRYSQYNINEDVLSLQLPPKYSGKVLKKFLDIFILTIRIIGIISVTAKPKLIDEGLAYTVEMETNEPLIGSGLWGGLTEIFFRLLSEEYKHFFKEYHIKPV